MPTSFEDRERGFEASFARDEELRFRVHARRDKLFAGWAATELGLSKEDAASLVSAIVKIADGPGHDDAMLRHLAGVFSASGRDVAAADLSAALERCAQQARAQLMAAPFDKPATP